MHISYYLKRWPFFSADWVNFMLYLYLFFCVKSINQSKKFGATTAVPP